MELFSMEGRYNRAKYFWITMAISVVGTIILVGLITGVGYLSRGSEVILNFLSVIGLIGGVGLAVVCAFPAVKRFHDLDRPGTHYWLLLIPFYNIYISLVLLFKMGINGPNQYGDDPLAQK